MKKISLLLISTISLLLMPAHAADIYEKKVPELFKPECFEHSTSKTFENKNGGFYKVNINKDDAVAVRNWYLVPIIPYTVGRDVYPYTSNLEGEQSLLYDNNLKTELLYDTEVNKEILVTFDTPLKKDGFIFNFKHSAKDFKPEVFVSEDGNKFSPVSFAWIKDYNLKALKITFSRRNQQACNIDASKCVRERINIHELSFMKYENVKLMRVQSGWKIAFYSWYNCRDTISLDTIKIPFEINTSTPEVDIELLSNPLYNPNIEKDSDADWVDNTDDNCPYVSNTNQKDSDADWVGDLCSDVDKDWIIWEKDNCPSVANPKQEDINRNDVWDLCEFDKDKDEVYDSEDNCINTPNPFQKDSDGDGIGNKCDNCEFTNPDQADLDKNWIGDICDTKEKFLKENDEDNDWVIDFNDNCRDIANPEQEDSDKDWVGDLCDNCISIQNKNQFDFNKNLIWDICEDSDSDWIDWMRDNCINVANPKQEDSDNNGIGNMCEDKDNDEILHHTDNCPWTYNPFQKDLDKDWLGDKCDEKDDRVLESNSSILIWVIAAIAVLFIVAIIFMIRTLKIKNLNNMKEEDMSYTQKKKYKQ